MVDMLRESLAMQKELQERSMGYAFHKMTPGERSEYLSEMILALEDELHEAMKEFSWKSWASAQYFNRDTFVGELVDAWHFLMNLLIAADVSAEELYTRYVTKNMLNAKRQREGYDGVSSKCPVCKRALDDDAVECTAERCAASN